MVLGERVAGAVCVRLVVEQLPIFAADLLEILVVHDLAIVCFGDDVIVHEFYSVLES